MEKQHSYNKGKALAVADFLIKDRVGFANVVEGCLAQPIGFMKEFMRREGTRDVPADGLLVARLLFHQMLQHVCHVTVLSAGQSAPDLMPQGVWNALAGQIVDPTAACGVPLEQHVRPGVNTGHADGPLHRSLQQAHSVRTAAEQQGWQR